MSVRSRIKEFEELAKSNEGSDGKRSEASKLKSTSYSSVKYRTRDMVQIVFILSTSSLKTALVSRISLLCPPHET